MLNRTPGNIVTFTLLSAICFVGTFSVAVSSAAAKETHYAVKCGPGFKLLKDKKNPTFRCKRKLTINVWQTGACTRGGRLVKGLYIPRNPRTRKAQLDRSTSFSCVKESNSRGRKQSHFTCKKLYLMAADHVPRNSPKRRDGTYSGFRSNPSARIKKNTCFKTKSVWVSEKPHFVAYRK